MPNGSDKPQCGWSLSMLTLVDSEQPSPDSASPNCTLPSPASPTSRLETAIRPHKDFGVLTVPTWLRYDPSRQLNLDWWTQLGLSIGCTCVVANLYYCQPLLIEIADAFHESYLMAAWLPTLYQVGYCVGLFFLSPLGDLVRRRQLIMVLVFITTFLSVGLALSQTLVAFHTLAILIGVFNITPQILIPMVADLAAPQHRARAVSVLQSGIMFGILLARVLAGVIAYFTTWRMVFYVAIGMQAVVLCGAYLLVPDQPPKNPHLTYTKILRTMIMYSISEPRLAQAALINIASVAGWTNFWVTLTFLLGEDPYHFSTLFIGLFGLVGVLGVFSGPLVGHYIDRLGPWYSVLVATFCLLVLQSIQTAAGGISIAVVIIVCFGIDAFRQTQTVSLQMIVFSISEEARSRLNAILTVSLFAGQVLGSSAGSHIFLQHGWRAAAALSVGLYGWQLLVLFMRGPNCGRHVWFGYEGGFGIGGQRLRQECVKTPSRPKSVDDKGMETAVSTLATVSDIWTSGSSCDPEERTTSHLV